MPTTTQLKGLPVSPGIVLAKASIFVPFRPSYTEQTIPEDWVQIEIKRLQKATDLILEQIEMLKKRKETEDEAISILRAQSMILKDPELFKSIREFVQKQHYSLEYAIYQAFQAYVDQFQHSGNPNLIERIPDLIELRDKLALILHGQEKQIEVPEEAILVAREIGIQDLLRVSNRIKGLVLERGGLTSHVAIIAHALGIPSVFGSYEAVERINDGELIGLDGYNGVIWLNISNAVRADIQLQMKKEDEFKKQISHIISLPSITRCGQPFNLLANAELPEESSGIHQMKCKKIGLLRTETMLMKDPDSQSPMQQYHYYKQFLFSGEIQEITIRLFDAGGDKIIGTNVLQEKNPNLGWRGARFLLGQEKLLRQQLYAISKLSGDYPGKVRLLVPMISTMHEVNLIKTQLEIVRRELDKSNVAYDKNMPLGLMIEVPSVALQAPDFAEHVDFFSIGTNDLTQYTMAADRGNDLVSDLYQQSNPAVWKLIKMSVDAAINAAIPISVCGEMAGRPCAAAALMGLGIRDLSMMSASMPKVKNLLTKKSLNEMQELATLLMRCYDAKEIEDAFLRFTGESAVA